MVNQPVSKLKKIRAEAQAIYDEQGLDEAARLPLWRRFAHFWVLVWKSFVRNRCPVRASALAYTSLLAMIPLLVVVVSVSTSLLRKEGEKSIEQMIDRMVTYVAPQLNLMTNAATVLSQENLPRDAAELEKIAQARKELVRNIHGFVSNVRTGTLGVSGMIALIFVVILMLVRIEDTFNDIWGATRGRTWLARVVQYWAAITLGPLVLVLAIGLTSSQQLQYVQMILEALPFIGRFLFKLLPFGVVALGFAMFYQFMPNARVEWRAALVGGMVGGGLWELNNLCSVMYVSKVVTQSKIYGSLGMIPVFMIGLYFSWMILLFGAQVAYAFQNRSVYLQEKQAEHVNQRGREFIALRLMELISDRFQRNATPLSELQIAQTLGVPSRLVSQLIQPLLYARLLAEVHGGEVAYMPGRPLDQITALDVLQALRVGRGQELATADDAARARVRQAFLQINQAESQVAGAVTLQGLVDQVPPEKPSNPLKI